jgi:hypothetical protein
MIYGGPTRLYGNYAQINISNNLKNYSKITATTYIPFNLSRSTYSSAFIPALRMSYRNIYYVESIDNQLQYNKGYLSSELIFSYYINSKLSLKDINPRWGMSLLYNNLTPRLHSKFYSADTYLLGTIYLPGMFRHHSIKLAGGFEDGLRMEMELPRGYSESEVFTLRESKKMSFSYTFPFLYPDVSIGPLAYIKRVHANFYFDRTSYTQFVYNGQIFKQKGDYTSYGLELGFKMNFLRFYIPVTPTIRYSYLDTFKDNRFSFYATTSFSF